MEGKQGENGFVKVNNRIDKLNCRNPDFPLFCEEPIYSSFFLKIISAEHPLRLS